MDESVNVRKVHISKVLMEESVIRDNSMLTLERAQQPIIPVPITLNDHPYIALADCGASNTLISSSILQDVQATCIPQNGSIISYDGK